MNRRSFLENAGFGLGWLAMSSLEAQEKGVDPLAPKPPHAAPRAKSVIFLFMSGGPSHVDLFERKPELERLAGQPIPESFGMFKTRRAVAKNKLKPGIWPFRKHGESGLEISDALPEIASCADDLCILRGCHGDSVTHPESVYLMNTGSILMGRPSLGSWAAYGMGTENRNMPAFVVLPDPTGWVKGGAPAWGNGYLPAAYQGTLLRGGPTPILHLNSPEGVSGEQQKSTLDLINSLLPTNDTSTAGMIAILNQRSGAHVADDLGSSPPSRAACGSATWAKPTAIKPARTRSG